jgi:hypothetical protein
MGSGGKLTLKDITLKGLTKDDGGNNVSLVKIGLMDKKYGGPGMEKDAVFIMEKGAVITGNYIAGAGDFNAYGGGVNILNTKGKFTMKGGTISNNDTFFGGGVHVGEGTFTMEHGTISANKSQGAGGGVHVNAGTFIMNGGTISNNTTGGITSKGEPRRSLRRRRACRFQCLCQ